MYLGSGVIYIEFDPLIFDLLRLPKIVSNVLNGYGVVDGVGGAGVVVRFVSKLMILIKN